jgi:aspartate/methionine/tyrosine aminotransferase
VSRDGKLVRAEEFCKTLQEKTGVMLLPADKGFGPRFAGFVRIGYVNDTDMMRKGLQEWGKFMDAGFSEVPLHS